MVKILIVEDDKDLNKTVCSFLIQNGYNATGCLNANEAYDALYVNLFDLIISDITMPEIDGFEFAKTVRSLNNEIPILFMTQRMISSQSRRAIESVLMTTWSSHSTRRNSWRA